MVAVGDTLTYARVFTNEEVLEFGEITGDKGRHHVVEDAQGRLVVHGLLTGSLPTKLAGDLNLLATNITYHFKRQVFTGDRIECSATLTAVKKVSEHRVDIQGTFETFNQDGINVLDGEFSGVIFG